MLNISVKDIENLRNNLSITQRLNMTRDCWERYNLLDPCNIVFPTTENPAILEKEVNPDGNFVIKTHDLFTHNQKLTPKEVAKSCEYYQKYVTFKGANNKTCTLAKELTWSYNHFCKNVESNLYKTET